MPTRTRWGAVFALIVAGVIAALQIGKASIALPVLQRELMLTLAAASWIVGAYGMLGAFAGLPAGIATSLFTARRVIIAGLATAGLGSIAGAFADSGPLMIATRAIEGCGFLGISLAVPRLLRTVAARQDLDTVMALSGSYLPTGLVLMMVLGPHVMAFGWQALWLVNGAVALAYLLVIARVDLQEPAAAAAPGRDLVPNIRTVLGAPGPILLALAFGFYTFHFMVLAGLLPSLLVGRVGLSISAAGIVTALAIAANAAGNLSAGVLLRYGVPTWAVAAGAFAFMGFAGFGIFSDAVPVIVVAVLAAMSLGLTGLIPASIYAAAPRFAPTSALLAIVLGLITQVTNLGNLVGPSAMALVVDSFGWERAPLLVLGLSLAGLAVALGLRIVLRRASPAAGR